MHSSRECSGIFFTFSGTGESVLYDVARTTQHKDRYSALSMAVRFIAELEEERKRRMLRPVISCIGVVSKSVLVEE